jgi:MFS transporter, DHA2 family, multidrug resistance protein
MAMSAPSPAVPALAQASADKANPRHVILFAAMIVGQFMAILDTQIVAASLTKIQSGLAASAEEITWIQTSYLIADVIMIPFSGFLARWLSTRVVFVASAAGFTLASIWAGMATSMTELILARAAQGFLGGAMTPIVFATAFTIFPPKVRDKTLVLMGLIVPLAPIIGPTLGGYITETLSWRWLFYINVVPGLAIMAVVWRLGDIDKGDPGLGKGFDFLGLLLMAICLGGLEYALEEGPRNDWFDDPWVGRIIVISAISGVVFIWRTLGHANPIIELRVFANRNFAIGTGLHALIGVGLFGSTFLVPVYLAVVRQLDAMQIGAVMTIGGLVMPPFAPVSNFLLKRIDHRLQIALGAALAGIGFYQATRMTADWDFFELLVPQIMRSIGMMLIYPALTRFALGSVQPQLMKSSSAMFNLSRQLGGAMGLALLNSLLSDRTQFHWQRLSEKVNAARPEVQFQMDRLRERADTLTGVDPDAYMLRRLAATVQRQAQVMSFADGFLTVAMAYFIVVGLMLMLLVLAPKPSHSSGPPLSGPPAGSGAPDARKE